MDPCQKEMLQAALQSFGKCDVVVMGESMKPFIRSGDIVSLSVMADIPCLGEVIAFFNDDQLLVHRIIWRKRLGPGDWRFWVWGDSSPGMPGKVSLSECLGKVVSLSRNNRKRNLWIFYPFRIIAIMAGIFLHGLHPLKK
jgi:hypothetical protein